MKMKRFDKDVYQIYNGETVVACIVAYSNGTWGINDRNDKKIVGGRFTKPKDAFTWFTENK